jgi:hypothetical protein
MLDIYGDNCAPCIQTKPALWLFNGSKTTEKTFKAYQINVSKASDKAW